jgi:hypothetical protein
VPDVRQYQLGLRRLATVPPVKIRERNLFVTRNWFDPTQSRREQGREGLHFGRLPRPLRLNW